MLQNLPWFDDQYKDKRHDIVFSTLSTLRDQQQDRLRYLHIYHRFYSTDDCNGNGIFRGMRRDDFGDLDLGDGGFSENVVRGVIDAVNSRLAGSTPKPSIVGSGADGSLKRKAKNLQKYLLGKWHKLGIDMHLRTLLRDACIFGTGCLKVCPDPQTGEIDLERRYIGLVFVDLHECRYRAPTQMFETFGASRRLMMKLYPKQAKLLKDANPPQRDRYTNLKNTTLLDEVGLIECWKLPDTPDEPGRHVIVASNCTLLDEPWEQDFFPFIFLRYSDPVLGFFGDGLAKQLLQIQIRINETINAIHESVRLCGDPVWLVNQRSNVALEHITNVPGNILTYNQVKPEVAVFQTVSPDTRAFLEDCRQRAYQTAGISELAATSQRPSGEWSGTALDNLNETEATRFYMTAKAYEAAAMEVAERLLSETKRLYDAADPEARRAMFKSTFSRAWNIETIKWSEVDMDRDQYNLQIWPVSSLPSTPAGRMQKIQDLLAGGMISPDWARELLSWPDDLRFEDLEDAGKDNAIRFVEESFYDAKDLTVEPFHDLQAMLTYAQQFYNLQQLNGADDMKLERVRQIMQQCTSLLQTQQQPQSQPTPQGVQQPQNGNQPAGSAPSAAA